MAVKNSDVTSAEEDFRRSQKLDSGSPVPVSYFDSEQEKASTTTDKTEDVKSLTPLLQEDPSQHQEPRSSQFLKDRWRWVKRLSSYRKSLSLGPTPSLNGGSQKAALSAGPQKPQQLWIPPHSFSDTYPPKVHNSQLTVTTPSWVLPITSPYGSWKEGKAGGFKLASHARGIMASLAYVSASCSMILANKAVLSSYNWQAPITLMLYQNFLAAVAVLFLRATSVVPREPISLHLVKLWLPVNFIFVGMLVTSFLALQHLQVAMATVLKNSTNVLTALGESYFSGVHHGIQVWMSLLLMIISAASAGHTDLSFDAVGYTWQGLNCFLTAAYVLTLRKVMKSARRFTPNGSPLGEFTMVLLNSALSLPLGIPMAIAFGEARYVAETPLLRSRSFVVAATLSGLLGLAISFSSMWCLHMTSPTTFSLIGSFNKVPLAILGVVLFRAPTSSSNLMSIMLGLFAGVMFAMAKVRQAQK